MEWTTLRHHTTTDRSTSGRTTLFRRLLPGIALVALLPLVVYGVLAAVLVGDLVERTAEPADGDSGRRNTAAVSAERRNQAAAVLRAVDADLTERADDVRSIAAAAEATDAVTERYPELDEIADWPTTLIQSRFAADDRLDNGGATDRWLSDRLAENTPFTALVLTEANGLVVGSAGGDADGFVHREEPWWRHAWETGVHAGWLEGGEHGRRVIVAVRLDAADGSPVGVVRATVDGRRLHAIADAATVTEDGIEVAVLSGDGALLAETASDHDATRIGSRPSSGSSTDETYATAGAAEVESAAVTTEDLVGGFAVAGDADDDGRFIVVVTQPLGSALAPFAIDPEAASDADRTARRLLLALGGIAIATAALAVVAARVAANRIRRPLEQLRHDTDELADHELPELVESLRSTGTAAPLAADAFAVGGADEVADLAQSLVALRAATVEVATTQAVGRERDIATVLLDLGRRNQQLIARQMRFIDQLERKESDPDVLASLFTLDLMATRMRRNAESLLVLAGEDTPRRVSTPRPVDEVVRAAAGEIEAFARVEVGALATVELKPYVVSDLTHLVAELLENATNFSAPETKVTVCGAVTADRAGYQLEIHDGGLGMSAERLGEANERLRDPDVVADGSTSYLGLYVVGRLAARHGITVELCDGDDGQGLVARVTVPSDVVVDLDQAVVPPPDAVGEDEPDVPVGPTGPEVTTAAVVSDSSVPDPTARRPAPRPVPAARRPGRANRPVPAHRTQLSASTAVEATDTATDADTDTDARSSSDDDTTGLPIPPFTARRSLASETGGDGPGETEERIVVRQRSRREPSDAATGVERAEEVRNKLNLFAGGVRAAKGTDRTAEGAGDSDLPEGDER